MLASFLLLAPLALPSQSHDVKVSPFDGMRWDEDQPEVQLEDRWYAPIEIDGLAVVDILAFCDRRWPGQRQKRFTEDMVEAMVGLGWEGDPVVELLLIELESGMERRLEAEMTRAKRTALRDARQRDARPTVLTAEQARAEVDAFERGLRERFAYLELGGVDLAAALQQLRDELTGDVAVTELAERLHRVLMLFRDGHAGVQAPGEAGVRGERYLPFLLADAGGGAVAFEPARGRLLDPKRPFVSALDGRPLEEWLAVTARDVAAGSPQLVRRRALGDLREIDAARQALGLPTGAPLLVTLTDAKGRRSEEREIELSRRRPTFGTWPRAESRVLEGRLGYLRIPRMDDSVADLRASMADFARTKGLIVDVRGNGGGTRELLIALAGYLIGPDEPAVVVNTARYRLALGFDDDHLEARFMRRAGWPGWTHRQREAVDAFAKDFEPEWAPGEGFSEWHYLVLDHTGDPAEYFYDRPVVVLSDAGCFSATDIFLGALAELPRVTLLGEPSSGGSARTQSFRLPLSGITVRCASMASFRPDGRLYDGRGIEVDVEVAPGPEYFLEDGEDAQLEAAIRRF